MANLERLKTLRETVTTRENEWDQRDWARKYSCGTTMCLAGWASVLAGKEIDWRKSKHRLRGESVVASWLTSGEYIGQFAADWLDLDEEEADDLFHAYTKQEALIVLDDLIAYEEESLDASID
jgi:hypothetical protein